MIVSARAARIAAAAVLALLAACASAQTRQLPAALAQMLSKQRQMEGDVAIHVVPVEGGPVLASLNAHVPMNPASTMKVLTSYAALSSLGPNYRWRTGIHLNGRLDGDVLHGDLVIKGGGDPKLVIEDLNELVARIRAKGLRVIRGDLLLDDSVYDLDDRSVEQFDGDPYQPYNVRPFGVLMNFKAVRFVMKPVNGGVDVAIDPPLADVELDVAVKPAPGRCRWGAGGLSIRVGGTQYKPLIRVEGPYSTACGEQSTFVAVLTHRQFVHSLFKAAWLAAGGEWVQGRTEIVRGAAKGAPWLEWVSPRTLADVVQDINKFSNNVMTRQVLLQATTEADRQPATVERVRIWLRRWYGAMNIDLPELIIDNGSGLSRQERISARGMASVLMSIAKSPLGETLRLSLPQVGIDGTMRNRLVSDPLAGRAWMKTGSLDNVRTIAGYLDAASGRRYVVVMLVNGDRAVHSQPAQDALLRWVYANG